MVQLTGLTRHLAMRVLVPCVSIIAAATLCGSAQSSRGWPPLRGGVLQRFERGRPEEMILFLSFSAPAPTESCSVTIRGGGLSFDGRDIWRGSVSWRELLAGVRVVGRLNPAIDTFVVVMDAVFRNRVHDHYEWVGRLDGIAPGRDTITTQLMLANTVRNGVMAHYGGVDLIEGPGDWGATPERMAFRPRSKPPRLTVASGLSTNSGAARDLRLTVLLGADGVVLRARCSDCGPKPELAKAVEAALLGRRLKPVMFEGRPVSAWTEVDVNLVSNK